MKRIVFSAVLAFVIALTVSLANGLGLPEALGNSLLFTMLVSASVAVLVWAMAMAQRKGYRPALGFWLVAILNLIGIAVLLLLPVRNNRTP